MRKYKFLPIVVVAVSIVWGYINLTPRQSAAPDFELPYYPDNRPLKLSSTYNRVVLLNFWASWCTVCRKEKQFLKALQQEHPDLLVLEVLTHDDEADIGSLARPFLHDADNLVASLYKVSSLPQTFLIDKQKHIRWHTYSSLDQTIKPHIAMLLQE